MPLRDTLISLGLRETALADEDLTPLARFFRLDQLELSDTTITDQSLELLKSRRCGLLGLAGTQLSATAIDELKRHNPQRVIEH